MNFTQCCIWSAFWMKRYGVGAGPDAGGLPVQSAFPRALQHVQRVHARQADTPQPTTLLQGETANTPETEQVSGSERGILKDKSALI